MRKFILSAAVLLLSVPNLIAQETEGEFGWDSHIIHRNGIDGQFRVDTNRFDMTVPMYIGDATSGFTVRGMGQILSPRWSYPVFKNEYTGQTTDSTDWLFVPRQRDSDYINQFKGVQDWQLTDVRLMLFQNSFSINITPAAQIAFYRLNTDYSKARNRDSLLFWPRTQLDVDDTEGGPRITGDGFPFIMFEEDLDATVNDQGAIQPTTITFDPPIDFSKDESIMVLYINDQADTVHQPIGGTTDQRDWQKLIGYMEYRDGVGSQTDPFRNPVPNAMVQGVYMRRPLGGTRDNDTVTKTYSLSVGSLPARINFNVLWVGNVVLNSNDVPNIETSVRYHFGVDAEAQGLKDVTPNPVREEATIPFSLAEKANVTLELYSLDGQKVATLLNNERYVPGKYTAHVNATQLESGSYLVRLSLNEMVYSTKFTVTK